tara:strand:- start:1628 stop:2635 length:1008 start_codon:yes stop_codon:yes gene_type:complete
MFLANKNTPAIQFKNVYKTYANNHVALNDVNFEIDSGQILILLGTSGCGKTTALKLINRLIEPSAGEILLFGKKIDTYPLYQLRRHIGYAIQHIGLFPHMNIYQNISVVPKLLQWTKAETDQRIRYLMDLIQLPFEDYSKRMPNQLSGGQRQRVGVARALAADPPIILMDEPFGALDPMTREQLQEEFKQLCRKIQKTIVFVTHDLFEAVKLGDKILLMNEGKIERQSTPRDLIDKLSDDFSRQFFSQHGFQLMLHTKTICELTPCKKTSKDYPIYDRNNDSHLQDDTSFYKVLNRILIETLDQVFIFHDDNFLGSISRDQIFNAVTDMLRRWKP